MPCFCFLEDTNWHDEARLLGAATILTLIITLALRILVTNKILDSIYARIQSSPLWERLEGTLREIFSVFRHPTRPHDHRIDLPREVYRCGGKTCPLDSTIRTRFDETEVSIYAWPSRGGVIVFDRANAVDFEFLELDRVSPPIKRLEDQKEEDAFCQRLLRLGAKWWDSEVRYLIVAAAREGRRWLGDGSLKVSEFPTVTRREQRSVLVGWPSSGGVWVAEGDTGCVGEDDAEDHDNEVLAYPSLLQVARTMDERSEILEREFGASFFPSVEEYEGGYAFLRSWDWGGEDIGEAGPRLQPDEAVWLWKHGTYRDPKGVKSP